LRTLVVGDIHGCFDEFQALLDKVGLSDDDEIIAVGDLVNRGPASDKVLAFFQNMPNTRSIIGNHEHKHLRAVRGDIEPTLSILHTRWLLGNDYGEAVRYMERLPLYIDLPDAWIVHGFWEPGVPLDEQEDRILIGTMGAQDYLETTCDGIWYEHYDGEKPLIVGHKDWSLSAQPFHYQDRVFGLDTGCVYGSKLTGLLLPDFEFFTVPARDVHWQKLMQQHESPS